jgi:uncharacterized membrane-anchored protein YitT (DUF2179 family)
MTAVSPSMRKKLYRTIRDYLGIVLGSAFLGFGIGVFLVDAKVVPGGVSGLSIAIHYLLGGRVSVGTLMWLFNLPLFIWGIRELGKRFGLRTFAGFTLTSFWLDFFRGEFFLFKGPAIPKSEAVLDLMQRDFFFMILCGAVLVGIGLGIIFKAKGSTGGSDIVAAIFSKRWSMKPGQVIMIVDFFVISLAAVILVTQKIAVERPVMVLTLFAFFLLFVSSYIIDVILDGFNYARAAIIISDRNDEISEVIRDELSRGATAIKGRGIYRNIDREILLTVVTRKEISYLKELVNDVDPKAFVIIHDVHEVLGEGFRRRV